MLQKQKQVMALVLGVVLAVPLLAIAGVRLITTPAGCYVTARPSASALEWGSVRRRGGEA